MKINGMTHGYAQQTFDVELTEDEKALPDYALVNLADARGDPKRAEQVYNFGGTVTRLPNNCARITVYID